MKWIGTDYRTPRVNSRKNLLPRVRTEISLGSELEYWYRGVEVRGYEENKLSASCAAKVKFALYFGESDFSRVSPFE